MPRGRESVLGARTPGGRSRSSAAPSAKRHAAGTVDATPPSPLPSARKEPVLGSSSDTSAAAGGEDDEVLDEHFAHALLGDGGVACDPDAHPHPMLCGVDLGGDFGDLADKSYASMFGDEAHAEAACGAGSPLTEEAFTGNGLAFDDAMSFVAEVKNRFQREPRTYAAFLELLRRYRADEAGAAETAAAVAKLFRRHTDLADAFGRFLPAGVTPTPRPARGAR